MQYLIANWKANKTLEEIHAWFETFLTLLEQDENLTRALESKNLHIIVCPAFPFLLTVKELTKNTGLSVGAQDISVKAPGKYTGEVPAALIRDIAEYTIIGHSERRSNFGETEEIVKEKIALATGNDITSIACIRTSEDIIPQHATIIAYEPVSAIGSGQNEDPALVIEMKRRLNLGTEQSFLYGGSVTRDNIAEYVHTREIDGYLVGTASLDAQHFFDLAKAVL